MFAELLWKTLEHFIWTAHDKVLAYDEGFTPQEDWFAAILPGDIEVSVTDCNVMEGSVMTVRHGDDQIKIVVGDIYGPTEEDDEFYVLDERPNWLDLA